MSPAACSAEREESHRERPRRGRPRGTSAPERAREKGDNARVTPPPRGRHRRGPAVSPDAQRAPPPRQSHAARSSALPDDTSAARLRVGAPEAKRTEGPSRSDSYRLTQTRKRSDDDGAIVVTPVRWASSARRSESDSELETLEGSLATMASVASLHVSEASMRPMRSMDVVTLFPGRGIEGDATRHGRHRDVLRIPRTGASAHRHLRGQRAPSPSEAYAATARLTVGHLRRNVVVTGMTAAELTASVGSCT